MGDYAPGVKLCWCGVNFPRDLKCQILSSLALEIAFKRRKEANMSNTASLTLHYTTLHYILFCFFLLKKSEQPEIVAFNRIVVDYNIHLLFYWRGDQRTGVDSCNTGQKNM